MSNPVPSRFRTVVPYGARAAMRSRSLVGPETRYKWLAKHPLDRGWWWVDMTGYLRGTNLTIAQIGRSQVTGDGALGIASTYTTPDGLLAGFKLMQGTPGLTYTVRPHLTLSDGTAWGADITLPVQSVVAVPTPDPTLVTNNQDIVLLGGIPYPTGASA